MVAGLDADLPGVLHRIGWEPDPLAWPPHQFAGHGRFDDARGQYRVLYTAEERIVCFLETLADIRPSLEGSPSLQRCHPTMNPKT